MTSEIKQLSSAARRAWAVQDWPTVNACATAILERHAEDPEGLFLSGLVAKAARQPAAAKRFFERALTLDPARYDAAIELASQHSMARRNAEAAALIARYEDSLANSPRYLDKAGTVYTEIGLPDRAWPLYRKANQLQPGVDLFMANLAACGVYLGKIDEAREMYIALLARHPQHQRNHYHLARLARAKDDSHIAQMKTVLRETSLPGDKNVFLYYAIGKELEDLGRWTEAFDYYRKAGNAVASVARYDIGDDLSIIEAVTKVCRRPWIESGTASDARASLNKTPIFIVGLPRTGTTLVERIVSSHSLVQSLGETQFMQMVIRRESGVKTVKGLSAAIVEAAATKDISRIARGYIEAVEYRLDDSPFFIDKLPYNFLFLGFIAKAYPQARIVHVRRNPMDSCFAMYKQVFTWAYKFSYTLDGLCRYYVAHDGLHRHWRDVLGDRLIEVEYETLVASQEDETRRMLDRLGLAFEAGCLHFDLNAAATTTASSVQVREKMHGRSVDRWKHFAEELEPLRSCLERQGVLVDRPG